MINYRNKHIVQLPLENDKFYTYDLSGVTKIDGFTKKDRYFNLRGNRHHFTTECYRNVIIPKLNEILNFGFNLNDFVIVAKYDKGDSGSTVDLSYMKPKNDLSFTVTGFEYGVEYTSDFLGLMWNEKVSGTTWFTPYHTLYCFPHSSSRVINNTIKNNRKILCNGDSCLIPVIPILSCYYKEVWYLDNRNEKEILPSEFNMMVFDDYLIMPFDKDLTYYTENNLKTTIEK